MTLDERPLTLPRTGECTMRSPESGREYRVLVAWPREPAPPQGYPVVYVLDANAAFATIVESIRMRSHKPTVTGISPAVVVGIAYTSDAPYDRVNRTFDYTEPTPAHLLPPNYEGAPWPPTGGAPHFANFIANTLKPAVENQFAIDATRQTLYGHSLGGYFVLQTLVKNPGSFSGYIAISPSIWWDKAGLERGASELGKRLAELQHQIQVAIAVGEYEEKLAPWQLAGEKSEAISARRGERRMVENARELAEIIRKHAASDVEISFNEFEGEDHASVVPIAIGRALRTVLRPK